MAKHNLEGGKKLKFIPPRFKGQYLDSLPNLFNPSSPHDALKHHFTSLKTDLIFLQLGVLVKKIPCNWFTNSKYMVIFFNFSPTSNHLHPLQVEHCGSNSRFVVDEDDNGKFRLERVKLNSEHTCKLFEKSSHTLHTKYPMFSRF